MSLKSTHRILRFVALILFGGLASAPVPGQADRSVRCSGRLVSIGEFSEQVEAKCGAPNHLYEWEYGHNSAISQIYDYERESYIAPLFTFGPIHMERWTYNFGSTRLIHYLYFKNGKLIKIETGERGSD